MSQANLDALNVSSSDVSLTSEVLSHPLNTACRAGEERAEQPPGTPAPAPTPVSSPGDSPGRRSVGVEVTPEDLHQPCAACAPCARHPPEPCVVPRPRSPSLPKHTTERSCPPAGSKTCRVYPEKPRNSARLPACAVAASKSSISPPSRAAHATRPPPPRRSCSPVCPPSCAASRPSPSPAPPPRTPAAANSPSAPLDTTEYLQHELFTRGAFRRVPASAPPADPALPHDSPDYRPPLRVGGGDRGADSGHSAHSAASPPSWCACDAAAAPAPARDDTAWQCAVADVAEMSQRCARRIESLARLIEHVRSEKNHLAGLQATPSDASSPEDGRSPLLQETPRLSKPAPTHAPVRTPPRTKTAGRSPTRPRSPGRAQRVEWSPDTPAAMTETADGADKTETWFERLQRQSPPSSGKQPPLTQRSPPRPYTAPQESTRPSRSPTRRPASSPHRTSMQSTSHKQPVTPPKHKPDQPSSPLRRSPEQPATSPLHSPGQQSASPRRPASSPPPCSPPSGGCGHVCPGVVVVSPRDICSPPASPTRSRPIVCAPAEEEAPEGLAGGDEETLWVFAPGSWPPCPGAWGRVVRPKPPPAMWRPGVPYVQQHELSAIPEADVSQSVLEADASGRRSPASPPPPPPPPHSPLVFGTVTGGAAEFHTGPRENLHGLLIASHLAAQRVDPWLAPDESSPPRITSPVSHSAPHAPHSPPPHSQHSPPAQAGFLPCSYSSPPPCAMSPHTISTPPRSHSPGPNSRHTSPPPRSRPCSPCALCCPRDPTAEQQEDENDPDIVAELIRRGVLRSPFSWMKSAESGPQIDVDVDVSVMSGASSDFVSDLLISGSSSTPRKAQRSSSDSPEQQHRRQRGGADTAIDPSHDVSSKQQQADDFLRQTVEESGALETQPEDLEGMFERLGLGWAASMLRKTQEAMAISSSSSDASRGASRPGGGGGSGGDNNCSYAPGGGTNVGVVAGTHSKPRRGHSTPADASAASDGSGSVSWARRQVVFTGDSDMSSVIGVSSRDLSTPSVSLVVKSKSINDQET